MTCYELYIIRIASFGSIPELREILSSVMDELEHPALLPISVFEAKRVIEEAFEGVEDNGSTMNWLISWNNYQAEFSRSDSLDFTDFIKITAGFKLSGEPENVKRLIDIAFAIDASIFDTYTGLFHSEICDKAALETLS